MKRPPNCGRAPPSGTSTSRSSARGGQHAEILQNFVDAIVERKPLIAPAAEGIRSVELGNAMLYSSEKGKTVELPLSGRAFETLLKTKIRTSRFKKTLRTANAGDITRSY